MSTNPTVTAAELDRNNLGMTIRFQVAEAVFQDTLAGISHEAELVEERKLMQEVPDYGLGRITTLVRLARAGSVHVAGTQEVELVL